MKILGVIGVMVAFVLLLSLLMAWPFMWMWNYAVVAALTVANPIGYWPAYCLMVFLSLFLAGSSSGKSH